MRMQLRTPIRFGDRSDLSSPRGVGPRVGARYDSDAFGRFSESIARTLGTGRFLVGQTVLVVIWIALNTVGLVNHWDPYPFILLNLAFSTQAGLRGPADPAGPEPAGRPGPGQHRARPGGGGQDPG